MSITLAAPVMTNFVKVVAGRNGSATAISLAPATLGRLKGVEEQEGAISQELGLSPAVSIPLISYLTAPGDYLMYSGVHICGGLRGGTPSHPRRPTDRYQEYLSASRSGFPCRVAGWCCGM
ncbi:hypothetical protein Mal35_20790 [Gimesia maris]|uniref:hypothetical protein n=1 Tax=Gimesia maris TaxID=122 RepID=UPI00118B9917|nr:hypothetical protein [Gimesia maris]QDT78630.1 hypothetical protein Mal35_20790 [Gimesia maris]